MMKQTIAVQLAVGAFSMCFLWSAAQAADPVTLTPLKIGTMSWQSNNFSMRGLPGLAVGEYPGNHSAGLAPSRKAGYAVWDLSSITDPIASGNFRSTLFVTSGWNGTQANDSSVESVAIRDVGTDLNVLINLRADGLPILLSHTTPARPIEVQEDLLSGLVYGSATATPGDVGQPFSITLDWRGIQDINTAAGTAMGMGFQPTSGPRELLGFASPQLVLYPFNAPVDGGAGLDFRLDDGDINTDGTVDLTERGVRHHLVANAAGMQTQDEKFSEVRRSFVFDAGGNPDPRTVLLKGDLEGTLAAGDATASVAATMQLLQADGTVLDEITYDETVMSTVLGDSRSSTVNERMLLQAELVPGEIYQVISRLDLLAELDGPLGTAEAFFADTFSVELSGIPEPASVVLLVFAAVGTLALRRRS